MYFGHMCPSAWVATKPLWWQPGGYIVFMITYMLCPSCFCEIWELCVSWITYDHLWPLIRGYIYIYIYICGLVSPCRVLPISFFEFLSCRKVSTLTSCFEHPVFNIGFGNSDNFVVCWRSADHSAGEKYFCPVLTWLVI